MMESPNSSNVQNSTNKSNNSSDLDHSDPNPKPKVVIASVETSNADVTDDRFSSTTPAVNSPANRSKKSVRWSEDLVEERTLLPLEKSDGLD
ncbi:hypothetical protein Hdeb2414_s0025g00657941 [Helianthus debilis subsp. tardiflorus]